ncbi:hypothetical protein BLNAU_14611 [Blattamonas nauphoetae]|uniref:Uncharacterized protein n=1 Tax=Blattamonas nauphoetae TaxID=2049346 RepID=A0ABQ9XGQ3_9EUKA|nr:hypothetical protein BLNAU_14611 [Blattamonas nauphoetae]
MILTFTLYFCSLYFAQTLLLQSSSLFIPLHLYVLGFFFAAFLFSHLRKTILLKLSTWRLVLTTVLTAASTTIQLYLILTALSNTPIYIVVLLSLLSLPLTMMNNSFILGHSHSTFSILSVLLMTVGVFMAVFSNSVPYRSVILLIIQLFIATFMHSLTTCILQLQPISMPCCRHIPKMKDEPVLSSSDPSAQPSALFYLVKAASKDDQKTSPIFPTDFRHIFTPFSSPFFDLARSTAEQSQSESENTTGTSPQKSESVSVKTICLFWRRRNVKTSSYHLLLSSLLMLCATTILTALLDLQNFVVLTLPFSHHLVAFPSFLQQGPLGAIYSLALLTIAVIATLSASTKPSTHRLLWYFVSIVLAVPAAIFFPATMKYFPLVPRVECSYTVFCIGCSLVWLSMFAIAFDEERILNFHSHFSEMLEGSSPKDKALFTSPLVYPQMDAVLNDVGPSPPQLSIPTTGGDTPLFSSTPNTLLRQYPPDTAESRTLFTLDVPIFGTYPNSMFEQESTDFLRKLYSQQAKTPQLSPMNDSGSMDSHAEYSDASSLTLQSVSSLSNSPSQSTISPLISSFFPHLSQNPHFSISTDTLTKHDLLFTHPHLFRRATNTPLTQLPSISPSPIASWPSQEECSSPLMVPFLNTETTPLFNPHTDYFNPKPITTEQHIPDPKIRNILTVARGSPSISAAFADYVLEPNHIPYLIIPKRPPTEPKEEPSASAGVFDLPPSDEMIEPEPPKSPVGEDRPVAPVFEYCVSVDESIPKHKRHRSIGTITQMDRDMLQRMDSCELDSPPPTLKRAIEHSTTHTTPHFTPIAGPRTPPSPLPSSPPDPINVFQPVSSSAISSSPPEYASIFGHFFSSTQLNPIKGISSIDNEQELQWSIGEDQEMEQHLSFLSSHSGNSIRKRKDSDQPTSRLDDSLTPVLSFDVSDDDTESSSRGVWGTIKRTICWFLNTFFAIVELLSVGMTLMTAASLIILIVVTTRTTIPKGEPDPDQPEPEVVEDVFPQTHFEEDERERFVEDDATDDSWKSFTILVENPPARTEGRSIDFNENTFVEV